MKINYFLKENETFKLDLFHSWKMTPVKQNNHKHTK